LRYLLVVLHLDLHLLVVVHLMMIHLVHRQKFRLQNCIVEQL
jgi:hypothetical protein